MRWGQDNADVILLTAWWLIKHQIEQRICESQSYTQRVVRFKHAYQWLVVSLSQHGGSFSLYDADIAVVCGCNMAFSMNDWWYEGYSAKLALAWRTTNNEKEACRPLSNHKHRSFKTCTRLAIILIIVRYTLIRETSRARLLCSREEPIIKAPSSTSQSWAE